MTKSHFNLFILILFCVILGLACQQKKNDTIIVAVSSNAQFAIAEIIKEFEFSTGIQAKVSIGSSGKLCAQILQGAPFDVFIAADTIYPEKIRTAGLAKYNPRIYAIGRLVLWTMHDDLKLSSELLRNNQIKYIAIANPRTAPYGKAALEYLNTNSLKDLLKEKIVLAESIGQVSQMVISKSADIGITAESIVRSAKISKQGSWLPIDNSSYDPILQSAVLMKTSDHKTHNAELFYNFLFTEEAKTIFQDYGYQVD